jgi:hypothetical protein
MRRVETGHVIIGRVYTSSDYVTFGMYVFLHIRFAWSVHHEDGGNLTVRNVKNYSTNTAPHPTTTYLLT